MLLDSILKFPLIKSIPQINNNKNTQGLSRIHNQLEFTTIKGLA